MRNVTASGRRGRALYMRGIYFDEPTTASVDDLPRSSRYPGEDEMELK